MSVRSRLLNILFWSVISAAFIGPGTVTTAAKAGADFGLPLLWALTFATIACLVLQEASARLTIASGMNLGQAIWRQAINGSRGNVILVLVALCILSGTAAYQAGNLLGAMAGTGLLFDLPPWLVILVIGLIAAAILFIPSIKIIARVLGSLVAFMGIAFLVTAIAISPSIPDVIRGLIRPTIPLNPGGALLVLGLIGTTVVPYNLFLVSGISTGQSIKEMRSGLVVAIVLGGIISMAVLVTGTAVSAPFTFPGLAGALDHYLGGKGTIILAVGLFAAGFTSAVTAPLASAVTVQSLFGNRDPQKWESGSWRFRLVWGIILVTGMAFGMAGFKPVPAIIVAQALNGLILPVIAVFLFLVVNNPQIMKNSFNSLPANILMTVVVFISLLIGMAGLIRAIAAGLDREIGDWRMTILGLAGTAVLIVGIVIYRISLMHK
jgi:Mn2+/Fe2+ NRAMP family transporter